MSETYFGEVNGHLIGLAMREAVRRAILVIRSEMFKLKIHGKKSHKEIDFVTSADTKVQRVYEELIRKNFPTFGIEGEEGLKIRPRKPTLNLKFTVDPADGTKALIRRQSYGIGTMISLIDVAQKEVLGAYVGDVMTQEIFGYSPGSDKVYRISEYNKPEELKIDTTLKLRDQFVVLLKSPYKHSALVQGLIKSPDQGGMFKDMNVVRGSVGICMTRLWKGEVGAVLLPGGTEMQWDRCPIIGISKKLGFVFLVIGECEGGIHFIEYDYNQTLHEKEINRPSDLLIAHGSRRNEMFFI